jgi:response regulator of citrate/malate metabolism
MLTALDQCDIVEQARDAGSIDRIAKPFTRQRLRAALTRVLGAEGAA